MDRPSRYRALGRRLWEMNLRQFLWDNFGFDIYEWEENEIRF